MVVQEFDDWLHEYFCANVCKTTSTELEQAFMDTE